MGSGTEKMKGHSRIRVITFVKYLESLNLSVVFFFKNTFYTFLKIIFISPSYWNKCLLVKNTVFKKD